MTCCRSASSPAGSARGSAGSSRTRRSRCSRSPASRSCSTSCAAAPRTAPTRSCSASATSASGSRRAIGDGAVRHRHRATPTTGPELRGTAGAVRGALPLLGDAFLVLYGDTYLRIDYADVQRVVVAASGLPALMTVLRNEGRWDTSATSSTTRGRVVALRQGHADPGDGLDRLRARRACDADALDARRPATSRTSPASTTRSPQRGELAATRRPSASTRSARRPRWPRPTASCAPPQARVGARSGLQPATNRYGRAGVSAVGQR